MPDLRFDPPLTEGTFLRRYKRFFADVRLDDGTEVVAHCPNTGSLAGCLVEGARVGIAPATNPERKLRWTWQLIQIDGTWVGMDTSIAVPLVERVILGGAIPALGGYERTVREVVYGDGGRSRIDLLLSRGGTAREAKAGGKRASAAARTAYDGDERVYVEVKNTTLVEARSRGRHAAFPDAVTERGKKHLEDLVQVVREGHRGVMVYCVQRRDCVAFAPADTIDAAYGAALRAAAKAGVELFALRFDPSPSRICFDAPLPIQLD